MRLNIELYRWCGYVAILLMVACSTETLESGRLSGDQKGSLYGNIVDIAGSSRVVVSDLPGIKATVRWVADDTIGVFGSEKGENLIYKVEGNEITNGGKTAKFSRDGDSPQGELFSYYPYSEGATFIDGAIKLYLPKVQKYSIVDGVVQPYSLCNFMVGRGDSESIDFKNIFALLKIGYRGDREETISKIIFKDLSDVPVSGDFKVVWEDGEPATEFIGAPSNIELEPTEGVDIKEGELKFFYLYIPARYYTKGFEVKFIMSDGREVVKTIGKVGGKRIFRSIIYPIGDNNPLPVEAEYKLQPGARVVSQEMMRHIIDVRVEEYVRYDSHLYEYYIYEVMMFVDKEFPANLGDVLLFDHTCDFMPGGYIGKVSSMSGDGEHRYLHLEPVEEFEDVFEEFTLGEPMWQEDGTENENGGVELDLASYISRIETPEGDDIDFTVDASNVRLEIPLSRGSNSFNKNFSTGDISFSYTPYKSKVTINLSTRLSIGMRMMMGIHKSTLEFLHLRLKPEFDLSSSVTLNMDLTAEKSIHLMTLYFTPIPVPPLAVVPVVYVYGVVGTDGTLSITFSNISLKASANAGVSYNKGDGLIPFFKMDKTELSMGSLVNTEESGLSAGFGVGVRTETGLKISGIMEALSIVTSKINFSVGWQMYYYTRLAEVSSSTEISARLRVVGGLLNYTTGSVNFKGDPIWQRFFVPQLNDRNTIFNYDNESGALDLTFKIQRNLFSKVEIGYKIWRGTPYTYGSGGNPIGFKSTGEAVVFNSLNSYYDLGDHKDGEGVGYTIYNVKTNFDAEPDVLYAVYPVYRELGSTEWKEVDSGSIDLYNLRYIRFKRPPKDDEKGSEGDDN